MFVPFPRLSAGGDDTNLDSTISGAADAWSPSVMDAADACLSEVHDEDDTTASAAPAAEADPALKPAVTKGQTQKAFLDSIASMQREGQQKFSLRSQHLVGLVEKPVCTSMFVPFPRLSAGDDDTNLDSTISGACCRCLVTVGYGRSRCSSQRGP